MCKSQQAGIYTQAELIFEQMDLERDFGDWARRRFHAPVVPLAITARSQQNVMELMPNCQALPSNGVSAAGGRPWWGPATSALGCSSRLFSWIREYQMPSR
ncbi:MAG TPA: hypothetical protein VGN34_08475 [Ktedonobacteraceae bacterium]